MKTLLALTLAILLMAPAFAQKNARAIDAEDAQVSAKIKPVGAPRVYKKVNGRELCIYILNPQDWKSTDRRPAIVFFHGGGWENGGPTQFNAQSEYFVTRGLVCMQVEYRLIKDNRKEAPIAPCLDAKSAMRWVRSHAAELGIDPDRIASAGGSAGGHLAAFVGMVDGTDDPKDDLSVSCRPQAMLLYNPALLGSATREEADANKGKPSAELIKTYSTISPFLSVSRDDPPGIIVVGDLDGVLPPPELKGFRERCEAAGVRMDAVVYPGEGHSFFGIMRSVDRFYDTTIEMDKFLGSLGWVEGPPTLTRQFVDAIAKNYPHVPNKLERQKQNKDKAK